MFLNFDISDATRYVPTSMRKQDDCDGLNLCSIADVSTLAATPTHCDPYADLQIPSSHPLGSFVYGDGSPLMSNEALANIERPGDNRVSINAAMVSVDIARLPGGAYFMRDNGANDATIYLNDNTRIKLLANGTAVICTANGLKTVKESFLMAVGDAMVKINPRTATVHLFSNDGSATNITGPEYWTRNRVPA